MRINKYLADCGIGSRRGVEQFVVGGRVRLNGNVVRDLATVVGDGDVVEFDGKVVRRQSKPVYIMLNKPIGYVTTCNDEFNRKTVMDLIDIPERIYPVGRLDYETEGLLLMTNDGEFAKRITHPSGNIRKIYIATLDREIDEKSTVALSKGVKIEVSPRNSTRKVFATVSGIVKVIKPNVIELTISEGKNRQVRKMFDAVGYKVVHLKRIAVGSYKLDNLPTGKWKMIANNQKKY